METISERNDADMVQPQDFHSHVSSRNKESVPYRQDLGCGRLKDQRGKILELMRAKHTGRIGKARIGVVPQSFSF